MLNNGSRSVYQGKTSQLVLAFDVGTTFSGISYAILEPGSIPAIRGITQFPGQENVGGDCKIPTLLYYSKDGVLQAAGAEAQDQLIEEKAADNQWYKVEWFKLHMRPKVASTAHLTTMIPPLPPGKTAMQVFADFLRYLQKCAQTYIEERHADGEKTWRALKPDARYVLTHPNGWEGTQQSEMRQAAVSAGLIPDDANGHSRLSFLTEGEASLHFCIQSDLTAKMVKSGRGVLIVDAGGGTIDISAYRYVQNSGFEEIAVPQCHLQGSVLVTTRAEALLDTLLKDSKFSVDLKHIAQSFDKSTKHVFKSSDDWQFIKFGSPSDRDESYNIRRGQLKLPGTEVAKCFAPSVDCIVNAIENHRCKISPDIRAVFLVGGFAANTYLFNIIKSRFAPGGIDVSRPDPNRVNKAVADGAISFYLGGFVTSRMARFDYGTSATVDYVASKVDHQSRSLSVRVDCIGRPILNGHFSKLLTKGTKVTENEEFRCSYSDVSLTKEDLKVVQINIICYRGNLKSIEWIDEDPALKLLLIISLVAGMFHTLCYVKADTASMARGLRVKKRKAGDTTMKYYEIYFDVVLKLGKTEFKAHLEWEEKGVTKTTPTTLFYDPEDSIPDFVQ
ncbi:hypothetical protein CVT24_003485 [Panaeolus cyanescens]|uniref:Uncharacterized protein n=1 Tax=Panaeolus cyanescens TaxID=181874 RepID=A0A409Y7X1_9AGAR|nr:hypothetical protein CVT24_003485 [Panaeolus cyanescens]